VELKQSVKEEITAILEQMTRRVMEKSLSKTETVFEKW
jgi:hypothetical protein